MVDDWQCKRFVGSLKSTNQVLTNRKQQISSEQNFAATLASFLPHFNEPTQFKKHANLCDTAFFVSPAPYFFQRATACRNPTLIGAQFQGEELAIYLILEGDNKYVEGDNKYVNTSTFEIDSTIVNSVFCQLAFYRAPHPACAHPQHSMIALLLKAQFSELRVLHDGYPQEVDSFPRDETANIQDLLGRASKTSVHFMMLPRLKGQTRVLTHNDLVSCLPSAASMDTLPAEEFQRACDEKLEKFSTSTPHSTVNGMTQISTDLNIKQWMMLGYHHVQQHSCTSGVPNALSSTYDTPKLVTWLWTKEQKKVLDLLEHVMKNKTLRANQEKRDILGRDEEAQVAAFWKQTLDGTTGGIDCQKHYLWHVPRVAQLDTCGTRFSEAVVRMLSVRSPRR